LENLSKPNNSNNNSSSNNDMNIPSGRGNEKINIPKQLALPS
jgi:hypothetical protein